MSGAMFMPLCGPGPRRGLSYRIAGRGAKGLEPADLGSPEPSEKDERAKRITRFLAATSQNFAILRIVARRGAMAVASYDG